MVAGFLAGYLEKADYEYALKLGTASGGATAFSYGIGTKELIVSDVIYNPEQTKLLKLASEKGCPTFNGLYMLLYQGAAAFKIWTGQDMPVDIIKEKYFTR